MLVLKSNDDQCFEVTIPAAKQSVLLKEMLDDADGTEGGEIPIPTMDGDTLRPIVKYVEYHASLSDDISPDSVKAWDETYIKALSDDKLFDVLKGANYFHIPQLLDLGCAAVAERIQTMSVDEVRAYMHLEADLTPAESEQAQKELDWLEGNN